MRRIVNGRRFTSYQTGPPNFPKLIDSKGRVYPPAEVVQATFDVNTNQFLHSLIYRPQGEASRLVLYRRETINFVVPFAFKNVPLP